MGYPMAGHLARAGYSMTVYNRTTSKADRWIEEHSGTIAPTPAAAAAGAQVVFACVGDDDDVRAVLMGGEGALAAMDAGAVLIDHTTASADLAREIAAAARARDVGFLDAPVSGGQIGAETGALTVMVGGEAEAFDRARPLIECYARRVERVGPSGHGQLAKMVNQVCIAGLLQGLAEGLHFGRAAGLDLDLVLDVISQGAAQSWQMDNRARSMLERHFNFGFAVDWMRKDLAIVQREAARNGARLAVAELVDQYYAEVQAMGGGRWDTSSLIERLERKREGRG
jgi:3-hydroxyisobutyrate dehydrogenase